MDPTSTPSEANDLDLADADQESAVQRVRDCQSALVALGYHLGHSDEPSDGITGEFEATTRAATLQFQEDNDLEMSGKMDHATYEALMQGLEQAQDMRAPADFDGDAAYVQGEQGGDNPLEHGQTLHEAQILDDSDATLLDVQDQLDAGSMPPELEDL